MDKTKIQLDAVSSWIDSGGRGKVVLPTGVGKTRLGAMAHRYIKGNTLVLTSKVPLIAQWKQELGETYTGDIACINSFYKYVGIDYDLLIVDECHKSYSPIFRKLYTELSYKNLLQLTATEIENEEYKKIADEIAPTVFELQLPDLEGTGILADYRIYNVAIPLDEKSKYKYKAFDSMFKEQAVKLSKLKRAIPSLNSYKSIFDIARQWVRTPVFDHSDAKLMDNMGELIKVSKAYWYAMTLRKQTIYSNTNKILASKLLIDYFKGRTWLVYTKTTEMAELMKKTIGGEVYHSKMSKAEREDVVKRFQEGEFNVLTSVDALIEGLDITRIDAIIASSYVSTTLSQIQSLGRSIRTDGSPKTALYFNLYTIDTQEKTWVEDRTKQFSPVWRDIDNIFTV